MEGAKIFAKLDRNRGFYQIQLSPEFMLLTLFTTPYSRFCHTRLPFSISSASDVYQKQICNILEDLDGALRLIDDVLKFGKDPRLLTVLNRFLLAHITLNKK